MCRDWIYDIEWHSGFYCEHLHPYHFPVACVSWLLAGVLLGVSLIGFLDFAWRAKHGHPTKLEQCRRLSALALLGAALGLLAPFGVFVLPTLCALLLAWWVYKLSLAGAEAVDVPEAAPLLPKG